MDRVVMGRLVMGRLVMGRLVMGRLVMGRLVMGRLVMGRLVMGRLVMGRLVMGRLEPSGRRGVGPGPFVDGIAGNHHVDQRRDDPDAAELRRSHRWLPSTPPRAADHATLHPRPARVHRNRRAQRTYRSPTTDEVSSR
jgi:hypothetical protein